MRQGSKGYITFVVTCDRCGGAVAVYADGSKEHAIVLHFVGKQLVKIIERDHDPEVEGFENEKKA